MTTRRGRADAIRAKPADAGYLAGPGIFWTIALEDLGDRHPGHDRRGHRDVARQPAGCAGELRAGRLGRPGPVAVASMSAAMYLGHQPSASLPAVGMLAVMAVVFPNPAALCYPPLFRRAQTSAQVTAGADPAARRRTR